MYTVVLTFLCDDALLPPLLHALLMEAVGVGLNGEQNFIVGCGGLGDFNDNGFWFASLQAHAFEYTCTGLRIHVEEREGHDLRHQQR